MSRDPEHVIGNIGHALAGLLVLSLVAVGCGVPTDRSVHSVADDDLPAALRPSTVTTTTGNVQGPHVLAVVYWIDGEHLVSDLESVSVPASLRSVLGLLQRGPTRKQARSGYRSALTGTSLVRHVNVIGSTASIDLDPSFADSLPSDQILAVAQFVLTATQRPGIKRVRVTVDGEPIQVPSADGSLTTEPLTRRDYQTLIAPR